MGSKRIRRTKELKFKIALEAIRGEKQISEIAHEYQVHPQQITRWKRELLEWGSELFSSKADRDIKQFEAEREALYKMIGHQQVVIDWFNKKLGILQLPSERP